jgi:hypothetical protein
LEYSLPDYARFEATWSRPRPLPWRVLGLVKALAFRVKALAFRIRGSTLARGLESLAAACPAPKWFCTLYSARSPSQQPAAHWSPLASWRKAFAGRSFQPVTQ